MAMAVATRVDLVAITDPPIVGEMRHSVSAEFGGIDRRALHDHIDAESVANAGQGHGHKIADVDAFGVIASVVFACTAGDQREETLSVNA